MAYYWEDGLLMRKWIQSQSGDLGWNTAYQVVVPAKCRLHVLTLGHDHDFAGHLGINKSYHRIMHYFFWPGLKSDVVKHCRSCHACQIAGKPNQGIRPAPLHPIPVIGEPFERIILDCMGPLPKSKSGHRFLLTIMCAATRYPEAIPLRLQKAKPVLKAPIRFFSTFEKNGSKLIRDPTLCLVCSSVAGVVHQTCDLQCIPSRVTRCAGAVTIKP